MNQKCRTLLEKQGQAHKWCTPMDPTYGQAKAGQPAWTYKWQLCEDTGCSFEDLPKAMNDREKWRERVRDIRASGTTWWWWWWWWSNQYQLIIIKNQWEIWVCFSATRLSHLVWCDTRSIFPLSRLLCNLVLIGITLENPASQRHHLGKGRQSFQCFCVNVKIFCLDSNPERKKFEVVSNNLLKPLFAFELSWSSFSCWFTWLVHKWDMDPFLPCLGTFCSWEVILKLFWKLRQMIMR